MPTARQTSDHDDELQTLDTADLSRVVAGAGDDMSSAMMMAMAMRNRGQAAAAPAPAPTSVAPWQPTITVDGVPQQLTNSGDGSFSTTSG